MYDGKSACVSWRTIGSSWLSGGGSRDLRVNADWSNMKILKWKRGGRRGRGDLMTELTSILYLIGSHNKDEHDNDKFKHNVALTGR